MKENESGDIIIAFAKIARTMIVGVMIAIFVIALSKEEALRNGNNYYCQSTGSISILNDHEAQFFCDGEFNVRFNYAESAQDILLDITKSKNYGIIISQEEIVQIYNLTSRRDFKTLWELP